ncbi:MAG TPA: MBL fold metallo-hydrolase, partial [Promineifilum sp.]|nr:MBL fold metallo-hydrolase [Promineifilum sp.]
RLSYGALSVLLTGDAEESSEMRMLQEGTPIQSAVLKAGHHGANTSSSAEFLKAVSPQIVVISVGRDNSYGHPHPDMLARAAGVGATVLRTDELGTLELESDGSQMWWSAEHNETAVP